MKFIRWIGILQGESQEELEHKEEAPSKPEQILAVDRISLTIASAVRKNPGMLSRNLVTSAANDAGADIPTAKSASLVNDVAMSLSTGTIAFPRGVHNVPTGSALTIHAAVSIDDLDAFIVDSNHLGQLTGTIDFPLLGAGI